MMQLFVIGAPFVAIGACIGFALGWVACSAVVDPEQPENADDDNANVLPFPERPGA